ncbi:autotransporter outer membrane beta-barrel domain-containing protein [Bartonella sp. CM120XJJH]|uniref:autotransporter outer membrane beta-barrel domain-containing protein n=1 Tax=Bartonella sp. CM120XJJH TaxID=3243544 RepID=UPI0035CF0EF1
MINVFKKRTSLYALTTSAFFFLQGVDTSMGLSWSSLSQLSLSSLLPRALSQSPKPEVAELPAPPLPQVASPNNGNGGGVPGAGGLGGAGVPGVGGVPGAVPGGSPGSASGDSAQGSGDSAQGGGDVRQSAGSVQGSESSNPSSACDAGSYKSVASIFCDDSGKHVMKGTIIQTKKSDQNAVYATIKSSSKPSSGVQGSVDGGGDQNSGLSEVIARVTGTTIVLNNASITGMAPTSIAVVPPIKDVSGDGAKGTEGDHTDDASSVATGVLARSFSKVQLERSHIKKFEVGVNAQQYSGIYMKGGGVYHTAIGAAADKGSFVILDGVVFNAARTGLHSSDDSRIMMKSGEINFAKGGVGVISERKGIVKLDGVRIKIKEESSGKDIPSVKSFAFLSHGGFISVHNGDVTGTDAVALLVANDITDTVEPIGISDAFKGFMSQRSLVVGEGHEIQRQNPVDDVQHVMDKAYTDIRSTITGNVNLSRYLSNSGNLSDTLKLRAEIRDSNIKIGGRDSYGISFGIMGELDSNGEKYEKNDNKLIISFGIPYDKLNNNGKKLRKVSAANDKGLVVSLTNTSLSVPEGVAVHGDDVDGVLFLKEGTVLSGDTFLKAETTSNLAVYAFKSSIVGDSKIGKDAYAKLYLSDESGWYLAKSNNRNLRQVNTGGEVNTGWVVDKGCIGSCISFVSLANSTIAFLPPRNENEGYQTLHIGEEQGVVYSASGDSKIYVNASFVSGDSDNVRLLSDQLLIYGNVTGKTKVYVNDSSVINTLNEKLRNGERVQRQSIQNQADRRENNSVPESIPIVQVFGEANSDSFELATTYVTLQGSPYQYVLRADPLQYSLSSGKTEKLWNFNLASKLEGGADRSVNSPVSKVQPNASGVPTPESGTPAPDSDRPASQDGNPVPQDGSPTSDRGRSASELGTPVSEPSVPTPQAGSSASEVSDPSLSQTGSLEKDSVDLSTLVVSRTHGLSGHTLSLSSGTPTSDEEKYGNMVVTKDGVGIVLLGQTDYSSYELGTDMLEYSITDENGDPITFDSSYDSISVIKNASTVGPLSTPAGTDVTTPSQSNEGSEDVRTITHEGTEVPEESASGISTPEFDAGSLAPQDGDPASQGGSSTSEFGSFTYEVDTPTSEITAPTSEFGSPAPEVGGSSGHTLSLSSETITSNEGGYGDLVTTEDGVDIVLLGQMDNDSYELGPDTVAHNITGENGDSITFDSSSDSVSVIENASTVTPLSIPATTDVTTSSQPNERSENVRTITHEGTGVSEAGETPSVSIVSGKKESVLVKPVLTASVGSKPSETVTVTESKKTVSKVSLPSVVKSTDSTKSTAGSKQPISVQTVAYKESRVPAVADVSSADKKVTPVRCNGVGQSQSSILCSDGKSYTVQQLTLKANNSTQHSMHVKSGTNIKLNAATIIGPNSGNGNAVDLAKVSAVSAVLAEENAEVVLENKSVIQSSVIGLEAQSGGKVTMNDGTVDALYVGALAGSGSSVNLKDTKINVTGDSAVGLASTGGKISMDSGAITLAKGVAVRSESGGSVELDKVNITAKKGQGKSDSAENLERAAFLLSDNASVDFKNGNVVTDAHALWIIKGDDVVEAGSSRKRRSSEVRPTVNHANIESSIVRVEGDGTYGIYFDGVIQKEGSEQNRGKDLATERVVVAKRSAESKQEKTPISITGTVSLKKTDFEVANGIAIYGDNSGGRVSLENKTTLAGDLLLKAENDSNILVSVDSSIVTGGVRVDKNSYAKLDLANSSQWILKRSAQRNLGTPDLRCVDSCISSVSFINSAIDFAPSESEGKYQTLHIGNGKGTVYAAQGDAVIYLNARLNPHDPSDQQVTDRLVIHGDVSGKTKIHVRGDAGNVGDAKANGKIAHSVSVIQVYGQAKKDSFQLDGNYVALRNSPYKYTLRAYAPEVTSKQEHVQQKFVKDGGEFWNFRLENQYVKSMGVSALPEQFVRSVVPQVPTYLVLPNSVFHAGLMDISNQNKQLETLRMTSTGMAEVRENPALYLRGYGGSYRYASDLSALEYGYGGDLDYHGVEAGVLLQTIESSDSSLSFGVMGTYGKLSLQPLNVEQSQKSAFDKWTATVYGSMQHNVGFYVDGLLSYGLFKGDVLTLARGKTATLKGNPLSVSLAGGQTIATGYKGFVFDPQVQVVYQHLQFNKARDIDNFDIEMGNLNQWVARVGGRLTKIPTGSEGVNAIAFYGKLYLAHGFEGKQSVHFNDAFKLGAFGSSLEAGLGFNAKLLPQFSLHADILYQHKLNKAGFSGTSFSGGVRYQF